MTSQHSSVLEAGSPQRLDPEWAAEIDAILLADGVPGAAVSLVTPKGVFEHFYGVAAAGSERPITRSTGFQICSLSKAYIATLALALEQQGVLRLDDPVAPLVPELDFEPSWLNTEISLRDLLSNRAGLQRGGLADFGLDSRFGYNEVARRIGHMRRTGPFRSTFSYCNPAFSVAALALERVTGTGFGDLLQQHLLRPAGLRETTFGPAARADAARARGHSVDRSGRLIEVDEDDDWSRPGAGGLMSSAADQQRWLRLNLGRGSLDGRSILPDAIWTQLWQPHVALERSQRQFWLGDPEAAFVAYGLGWFLSLYDGHFMAVHTGGGIGWRTRSAMLPDVGIALSILINVDGKTGGAVQNHLLDRCLGRKAQPWLERVHADRDAKLSAAAAYLDEAMPVGREQPLPADHIAGHFQSPESGVALITQSGGVLLFELPDGRLWDGILRPLGGSIYEHEVTGPIGTYDGPRAPAPRIRFTVEGGRAGRFTHSSMGEFVRC